MITYKYYRERIILLKYLKIWLDIILKIILLDHQNNYVGSIMSNTTNSFDILAISLSVLYIHSDGPAKLCLDLYLPKFLEKYFSQTVLFV